MIYRYERVGETEGRGGKVIADGRVHCRIVSVPMTSFLRVQVQALHETVT